LSYSAYYFKYNCYVFNIILFCANKNTGRNVEKQKEILNIKGKNIEF